MNDILACEYPEIAEVGSLRALDCFVTNISLSLYTQSAGPVQFLNNFSVYRAFALKFVV